MSSYNVLIVDDAAETRLFLKSIVNSIGYKPLEAKSGLEALKILSTQSVDLVLLDILMPNMDGYQILEKINQMKEDRTFRVAFITGIRGELDQEKLRELKPDEIIHKTVDIHVLKNKIKKLVLHDGRPKEPKKGDQTEYGLTAEGHPVTPKEKEEFELKATITNIPIVAHIVLTKTSSLNTNFIFISNVEFKIDSVLQLAGADSLEKLGIEGEFEVTVKKCVDFGDKFVVEVEMNSKWGNTQTFIEEV